MSVASQNLCLKDKGRIVCFCLVFVYLCCYLTSFMQTILINYVVTDIHSDICVVLQNAVTQKSN